MEVLTVKEAVQRVNSGGNLEGVVLDERTIKQVNVRDAMVLSRGGIVIPEQNIYYNDDEIEYDEEIDELEITSGIVKLSWEEKAKKAEEYSERSKERKEAMIDLSTEEPEIDDWIAKNKKKLETLLKPIVINLFNAEKVIKE
jgi:hypothetical protein